MRWYRRRRYIKAYRILRKEAERHSRAGHDTVFVAVNEALMLLDCRNCPELLP
jgi:hypothetical protein